MRLSISSRLLCAEETVAVSLYDPPVTSGEVEEVYNVSLIFGIKTYHRKGNLLSLEKVDIINQLNFAIGI